MSQYSLVDEKKQPVSDSLLVVAVAGNGNGNGVANASTPLLSQSSQSSQSSPPGGPLHTGTRSPNASVSSEGSGGSGGGAGSPKANGSGNPLHRLAVDGCTDELFTKAMNEHANELNGIDKHGFTPLLLAAEHNHPAIVTLILQRMTAAAAAAPPPPAAAASNSPPPPAGTGSANTTVAPISEIDRVRHPQSGRTALCVAVAAGHADVVRRFVDAVSDAKRPASVDFSIVDSKQQRILECVPAGRDDIRKLVLDGMDRNRETAKAAAAGGAARPDCDRVCEGCVIA